MLVASDKRQALITEAVATRKPSLAELVARLDLDNTDLVLVESFRHLPYPKIELYRKVLGKTLLHPDDHSIIAVASDHLADTGGLPALDMNDTTAIAAFIIAWLNTTTH